VNSKLELSESLVHIFEQQVTRDEAILKLASLLEAAGYVKDSFGQACIEREKVFPTGLPTEPYGIAIPHTDCEHVKHGAIAVGILPKSVQFQEMGCLDDTFVDAHAIVVLAISDPQAVTGVLRELALSFQDADFLTELKEARNARSVLCLFARQTPNVVEVVPSSPQSEEEA
jgi:PTS system galactitol-specific IIA component